MLNYAVFCQLKKHLSEMSALTANLLSQSGGFLEGCVAYLLKLQEFANAQQLYIATDVSMCLNKILTYKSEHRNIGGSSRYNLRKEKDANAAACLEALHGEIKKFLDKDVRTFEECGDIWRQVLSRAVAKGYRFDSVKPEDRLSEIFKAVQGDEEFLPYYAHIVGLIGIFNAQAVLDSTLPQLNL